MSALDELRAGKPEGEFVALLQRAIWAAARRRGFPPPDGFERWDAAAVKSVVVEFFADPQTPRRLTDLEARSRTDDALRARLQVVVRNFLADIGRESPVGRLVLRVNEVLNDTPEFERAAPYWRLSGVGGDPVLVDLDALIMLAAKIEVVVPTAWTKGDREGPDLDAASVIRIATMLLTEVDGSLTSAVIAQVTAARLGIASGPLLVDATAFDPPRSLGDSADSTGDAAICDLRAREIFELLNEQERISVGHLVGVEELGRALGVSGSQAHNIRKRASKRIQQELDGDEDRDSVGATLAELARLWTESWISAAVPT